jgi:hypothetical protein
MCANTQPRLPQVREKADCAHPPPARPKTQKTGCACAGRSCVASGPGAGGIQLMAVETSPTLGAAVTL